MMLIQINHKLNKSFPNYIEIAVRGWL